MLKRIRPLILSLLCCTIAPAVFGEAPAKVDPAALEAWRGLRFGLFIHWGPVSLTGHEIGWSRGKQTPISAYDQLHKRFNPSEFNAEAWVLAAKNAGMKYMVLTTKHHDGFCLWPSDATDYDIAGTPFQRDPVKELAEACRKHGLKFGTYYSVCDWYHPDFPKGSPGGRTKKPNANLDRYASFLNQQVTELVENYGPLVTMWFDVPQVFGARHGVPVVNMLRQLQPDIVINNRAYAGFPGDYTTPEQRIGGFDRERPWETCMTICRQWAWKPNDSMKSLAVCVQNLLRTAGGDGNFLFNVGPTAEGVIEERQVQRLKEMGDWIAKYAEGIYATRGGPFKPGSWGASTCKDNKVYLYVMKWNGNGRLMLPAVAQRVTACRVLSGGEVEWAQTDEGIDIAVPSDYQAAIATVIELTVDGPAFDITPADVRYRSDSLAYGKKVTASNVFQGKKEYAPGRALDDNPATRWATDAGTLSAWLEVDLGEPVEIDRVLIDEWPGKGSRVRAFEIQVRQGEDWTTVAEGEAIGGDWKGAFDPVTTSSVRLNISEATEGPTLNEFQVFGPRK